MAVVIGKILIPQHFHAELGPALRESGLEPVLYDGEGRILGNSEGTIALFRWWISGEVGDQMLVDHPDLRWIHTGSTGIDHILTPNFLDRRPQLTNSAGVQAPSIAEWVVGSMLAMEKDLPAMLEQQRKRIWETVQRDEMTSRTIVFLGAGEIAKAIATRWKPFGSRMIAIRRKQASVAPFDEVATTDSLEAMLAEADWLIITVPLTNETRGMLSDERLSALKLGARIVNVSRGEILDQQALVAHLQSGAIGGAILDVFDEEPLPEAHPLWEMANVYLLPHTTWRSPEVKQRQIDLFLENAAKFSRGEEMRNIVDVDAGY